MAAFTEFVRWGNGGEGPKEGYHRSLIEGMWTAQQFAPALGINQGAARDIMTGRRTGTPLGAKIKGTWFININIAIECIQKRQAEK